MNRWVKFGGKWYVAEKCEDEKIGLYYLIAGHICPVGEVEEFGKYFILNEEE
jgi:hypothetical protein